MYIATGQEQTTSLPGSEYIAENLSSLTPFICCKFLQFDDYLTVVTVIKYDLV